MPYVKKISFILKPVIAGMVYYFINNPLYEIKIDELPLSPSCFFIAVHCL